MYQMPTYAANIADWNWELPALLNVDAQASINNYIKAWFSSSASFPLKVFIPFLLEVSFQLLDGWN